MPHITALFPAAVLAAGLLAAPSAHAQATPAPQVAAEGAWARATPAGAKVGAVYATLTSPAADTLLGVSTPASRVAEVHEMTMDGGVMRMRELAGGLPLPAGQPVTLRPGGLHIMLVDLAAPLKAGDTVQLRLSFAHSAPVEVTARVAAIGAAGPPGSAAPAMKMP